MAAQSRASVNVLVQPEKESLEAIYCAELVATTYQYMGLLPNERPASWYDPGRFWSGDSLELVPPFKLGGEIAVTVPGPAEATAEPAPGPAPDAPSSDEPSGPRLRLPGRRRRSPPQ